MDLEGYHMEISEMSPDEAKELKQYFKGMLFCFIEFFGVFEFNNLPTKRW